MYLGHDFSPGMVKWSGQGWHLASHGSPKLHIEVKRAMMTA
jgi:hypothetical protein